MPPFRDRETRASAGVTWWQRGLVVSAALAAVAATIWAVTEAAPEAAGRYLPWPAIALAPVFVRQQPSFRLGCFAAGSVLVVFGVLGVLLGWFIFIPAGLAVLAAGTTGGRIAWLGGVLSAVVAATSLGYAVDKLVLVYGPPDAFVVQFDGQQYQQHEDLLDQLWYSPAPFGPRSNECLHRRG